MSFDAPYYTIKVVPKNGDPIRVVTDRISSFKFSDSERKTDTCTFTVDNFNLENFDDPLFRKGQHLLLSWGYKGKSALERQACITKVTGFTTLTVQARSRSIVMNTEEKTRCFENLTHSQIVHKILKEDYTSMFTGKNLHIQQTDEKIEIKTQTKETDAQFFRSLAGENGFEFYVDQNGFHWKARDLNQIPIRTFTWYGTGDNTSSIVGTPVVENDVMGKIVHVQSTGRNARTKKTIGKRSVGQDDKDILSLSEGADICDSFGKPDCNRLIESRVAKKQIRNTTAQSESQAKTESVSRLKRSSQLTIKMTLTVIGDPNIYSKSVVQLFGMGTFLSQLYYVSDVDHVINQSGYVSVLKLKGDGNGKWAKKSKLAIGLSHIDNGDKKRNPKNKKGKKEDKGNNTSQSTELVPITLASENFEKKQVVTQYIESHALQQSLPLSEVEE